MFNTIVRAAGAVGAAPGVAFRYGSGQMMWLLAAPHYCYLGLKRCGNFCLKMGNFGYKNLVFAYISNCKLTLETKCTFKRKTAQEFSAMLDFSKMR
jgi:hypothetical protein